MPRSLKHHWQHLRRQPCSVSGHSSNVHPADSYVATRTRSHRHLNNGMQNRKLSHITTVLTLHFPAPQTAPLYTGTCDIHAHLIQTLLRHGHLSECYQRFVPSKTPYCPCDSTTIQTSSHILRNCPLHEDVCPHIRQVSPALNLQIIPTTFRSSPPREKDSQHSPASWQALPLSQNLVTETSVTTCPSREAPYMPVSALQGPPSSIGGEQEAASLVDAPPNA